MEHLSKQETWEYACKTTRLLIAKSIAELSNSKDLSDSTQLILLSLSSSVREYPLPDMPKTPEDVDKLFNHGL